MKNNRCALQEKERKRMQGTSANIHDRIWRSVTNEPSIIIDGSAIKDERARVKCYKDAQGARKQRQREGEIQKWE